MNGPLAWLTMESLLVSPAGWALLLGGLGLWMRLTLHGRIWRSLGGALGFVGVLLLAVSLPRVGEGLAQLCFWILAAITVIAAAVAVTSRSAVYMAIWFALSLLGTAGLLLYQGAQFLGVATIAVYAGAIVVTFLFVLMLAQPRGSAAYDRISWAWFPAPLAIVAGGILLGVLLRTTAQWDTEAPGLGPVTSAKVLADAHMAHFGGQLFARHLVAVEVAATLLLVALVGAIAMIIHGKRPDDTQRLEQVTAAPSRLSDASDQNAWQGETAP
jgi:NADH-quinone oxidoreductase subunit J